ncbi:MAG TPA: TetR/AcrR family transcriptional regulator [Candidatus Stackebrandtia excrementipullorum]|nr:TetR/AcrR family transcriptional regulator [Candidatus Stackebrandtia excrementipullorum]
MNIASPTTENALYPPIRQQRRRNITVTDIVDTATTLADEHGLDAMSMRKVAQRLGVGTMFLYTYLPSRAELIELMVDAVCERIAAGGHREDLGWRRRLSDCAHDDLLAHLRHPWLVDAHSQRPRKGPGATAKYNRELASIDRIGLSDSEMATMVTLVTAHVQASARRHLNTRHRPHTTDPRRSPVAARVIAADTCDGFEFGLNRILDGIAAITRRR